MFATGAAWLERSLRETEVNDAASVALREGVRVVFLLDGNTTVLELGAVRELPRHVHLRELGLGVEHLRRAGVHSATWSTRPQSSRRN